MAREVTIRGTTYTSHANAARALGVTRAAVSVAVKRGKLDGVGLRQTCTSNVPFEVGPFKFPSYSACDVYTGSSPGYTATVMNRGGTEAKRNLVRRLLRAKREKQHI